jgi:hypothetical protein
MARPGFVLQVDDRTPPLLVPEGARYRLERFPLGTEVVYPAEPLPAVEDLSEQIAAALDSPVGSAPLQERLRPDTKLTIVFDDVTTPAPPIRGTDVRSRIIEAVLTRAAAAGVDDVALVCATGLHRRTTEAELEQMLGERVFRSFFADGLLTNHDAEDADQLRVVGSTEAGPIEVNARAADSDLVVHVRVVVDPESSAVALATGLGSAATIRRVRGTSAVDSEAGGSPAADLESDICAAVESALPLFTIEAVLDNQVFGPPLELLGRREWEWSIREQAAWLGLRHALALAPGKASSRLLNATGGAYSVIGVHAGQPAEVRKLSRRLVGEQQLVEVSGQADVAVLGIPPHNRYAAGSVVNPLLAAWQGLAEAFRCHTGRPFVRHGGALVLYHPLAPEFSPLHHPSFVDFFAEVLSTTTDASQVQEKFEDRYATDSWYIHLYRTSHAFHGVLPLQLWYQIAQARSWCSDIIWVGADRSSTERMGFRAASSLADALEMVSATVGRSPRIRYLHAPPRVRVDVR